MLLGVTMLSWVAMFSLHFVYICACYISQNVLTWNDAEQYCVSQCGSHLASIHSTQEQDLIMNIADRYEPFWAGFQNIWIGLNGSQNGYSWTDGSDFIFGNNFNSLICFLKPIKKRKVTATAAKSL